MSARKIFLADIFQLLYFFPEDPSPEVNYLRLPLLKSGDLRDKGGDTSLSILDKNEDEDAEGQRAASFV